MCLCLCTHMFIMAYTWPTGYGPSSPTIMSSNKKAKDPVVVYETGCLGSPNLVLES